MPQQILNRDEIRLLSGIVRNHRLSFEIISKEKTLRSLKDKMSELFASLKGDENDCIIVTVEKK
jgi:superoxide dismutase